MFRLAGPRSLSVIPLVAFALVTSLSADEERVPAPSRAGVATDGWAAPAPPPLTALETRLRRPLVPPPAASASPPAPEAQREAPPEPTATPAARPPVTARPLATPAPEPPQGTACASTAFCYPRLGIAGPIVPYTDCFGGSDIGTSIRSFTCLSDHYLMGHAYTQFGRITGWRAGDVVFAYGRAFTVTGAFTQGSCAAPQLPLAPLELQTSLSPNACGPVLVVQAR